MTFLVRFYTPTPSTGSVGHVDLQNELQIDIFTSTNSNIQLPAFHLPRQPSFQGVVEAVPVEGRTILLGLPPQSLLQALQRTFAWKVNAGTHSTYVIYKTSSTHILVPESVK